MPMVDIKPRRQLTDYTCGPASLRTVLKFFGKNAYEKPMIKYAKINSNYGTSHTQMRKLARKYKFSCYTKENAGIKDIEHWIDKKVPVIVDYQDWGANNGRNGHYAVVIGYNKKFLTIADPANYDYGDRRHYAGVKRISKKKFLKRWWDIDGKGSGVALIQKFDNKELDLSDVPKKYIIKGWFCVVKPK